MVKKQVALALGLRRTQPRGCGTASPLLYRFAVCVRLDVPKTLLITYSPWLNNCASHFRGCQSRRSQNNTRPSSVDDPRLSFVPLIYLPILARREFPVEGNIGCLSIRYVSVFNIYHTAVPRDGISFIGYRKRGQVRQLWPLTVP
jgi:hypothetical protein